MYEGDVIFASAFGAYAPTADTVCVKKVIFLFID